jgi:uncharacterized protein YodC (DUF2158 family)
VDPAKVKVGAVVALKSGGPLMTVVKVSADAESVECCWCDEEGRPHRCPLPIEALNGPRE